MGYKDEDSKRHSRRREGEPPEDDEGDHNESSSDVLLHDEEEPEAAATVLSKKTVTIVVLGDIGRSPRMRYHALSLAQEGYFVHFIGYGGSSLPQRILENNKIWVQTMPEPPSFLQSKEKDFVFAWDLRSYCI
jgi:hypothetical protein